MALLIKKLVTSFDMTQIGCGYLLWGKHSTWSEGKAGIVTSASEVQLTVQFFPGIGNVTNHFVIPVPEVEAGEWQIRWSEDMINIHEYGIELDDKKPDVGETEGDSNETGGIDL